jgi:hypothetical protein
VVAVAGWLGLIALGWLFGGLPLAAVAAALAGWHLLRPPPPRLLVLAGAAVFAAVPVVWLALRPDPNLPISPLIVADNPWPHRLAAVGLLLVGVGVVRSERARSRRAAADPPDLPDPPERPDDLDWADGLVQPGGLVRARLDGPFRLDRADQLDRARLDGPGGLDRAGGPGRARLDPPDGLGRARLDPPNGPDRADWPASPPTGEETR